MHFIKIGRLLTLQATICTKLFGMTDDKKVTGPLYNSIRYFFRFYFSIYVEFQNLLAICLKFKEDMAKSIVLLKFMAPRINLDEKEKKGYVVYSMI